MKEYSRVEDIVLQQSGRGMDVLRPFLPEYYIEETASVLLALPRGNVLITTGFYVGGAAESDGPAGAVALSEALNRLGFSCTILTDSWCRGYFERAGLDVVYVPTGKESEAETAGKSADEILKGILNLYRPTALISTERCGINARGDYENMRGKSILQNTAPIDRLFPEAMRRGIFTVGIGDGGNEIGMGNLCGEIAAHLSLSPCTVKTDRLLIATVSNWGAYGLAAELAGQSGQRLMLSAEYMEGYLQELAAIGCKDGVTGKTDATVDGFPEGTEIRVYRELLRYAERKAEYDDLRYAG